MFDAVSCLYSSSGICALVSGVATLAGKTPYEPMLFWFGLAGLVLGVLIRFTAKPSGRRVMRRARKDRERRCPSS